MNNDEGHKIVIPIHKSKDIPKGTLYNIVVRQVALDVAEFLKL